MKDNKINKLSAGTRLIEMPGSTHSKTWEIKEQSGDSVTVKLVDQAVGYDYATKSDEKLRHTVSYHDLSEMIERRIRTNEDGTETFEITDVLPGMYHDDHWVQDEN